MDVREIRRIIPLLMLVILALSVMGAGCIGEKAKNIPSETPSAESKVQTTGAPRLVEIVDSVGRHVEVPARVDRVLAIGCTLREVVYLLRNEAPEKVVGIELREAAEVRKENGKWPAGLDLPYIAAYPELRKKPVIRSGKTLNLEMIVELKPDVIFAGPWNVDEADEIQQKTGIPVVIVYVGSVGTKEQLEKYYESLRLMGRILGKENRAEELINTMNSYLADLDGRTKDIPDKKKPTVYIAGRAYYGTHGVLGTDPHWPPFEWVHAKNVASGVDDESKGINVDKEALVQWNPDVIFVSAVSLPFVLSDIENDPAYGPLKEKPLYSVMPYCWFAYNKEVGIVDAYFVGKILYPEEFADIDMDKKAEEIFVEFLGEQGRDAYRILKERFHAFEKITPGDGE